MNSQLSLELWSYSIQPFPPSLTRSKVCTLVLSNLRDADLPSELEFNT